MSLFEFARVSGRRQIDVKAFAMSLCSMTTNLARENTIATLRDRTLTLNRLFQEKCAVTLHVSSSSHKRMSQGDLYVHPQAYRPIKCM